MFSTSNDSSGPVLTMQNTQTATHVFVRDADRSGSVGRKRQKHKKVRTGCLTCKIRRKKCDETKPACIRCTSTGRKCDGYALQSSSQGCWKDSDSNSTAGSSQMIVSPKPEFLWYPVALFNPGITLSQIESQCFSYFQHCTAPQFASHLLSSVWRIELGRVACMPTHPLLLCAAAALGAAHRRFALGICPEAFEYCAHAANLSSKASRMLKALKYANEKFKSVAAEDNMVYPLLHNPHVENVIMSGELLLGLFQAFQDEYVASSRHIMAGYDSLLCQPLKLVHSESWQWMAESKPGVFSRLMHQLRCRTIYIFQSEIKSRAHFVNGEMQLLPVPDTFNNLEEARDYLFTELEGHLYSSARACASFDIRLASQKYITQRLNLWKKAYENLRKEFIGQLQPQQKLVHTLLDLTRTATYLITLLNLFVDTTSFEMLSLEGPSEEDVGPDEVLNHAARSLSDLARRVGDERPDTLIAEAKRMIEKTLIEHPIFTYDIYDFWVQLPETLTKTSWEPFESSIAHKLVKKGMSGGSTSKGTWDLLGAFGIARRISYLEEIATVRALRQIIPNYVDSRWLDVSCIKMDSRILVVRYFYPDKENSGYHWIQDWWSF